MAISTNLNYPAEYLPCPLKENFGLKADFSAKSTRWLPAGGDKGELIRRHLQPVSWILLMVRLSFSKPGTGYHYRWG
jgi:hypothetical protein